MKREEKREIKREKGRKEGKKSNYNEGTKNEKVKSIKEQGYLL